MVFQGELNKQALSLSIHSPQRPSQLFVLCAKVQMSHSKHLQPWPSSNYWPYQGLRIKKTHTHTHTHTCERVSPCLCSARGQCLSGCGKAPPGLGVGGLFGETAAPPVPCGSLLVPDSLLAPSAPSEAPLFFFTATFLHCRAPWLPQGAPAPIRKHRRGSRVAHYSRRRIDHANKTLHGQWQLHGGQ